MPEDGSLRSSRARSLERGLGVVIAVVGAGVGGYALGVTSHPARRVAPAARRAHPPASTTHSRNTTSTASARSEPSAPVGAVGGSHVPGGTGLYVDGGAGTPHYFLAWNLGPDGAISGAVDFVYQDGQTSVVFTFTGQFDGSDTVATLTPHAIAQGTGSASQPPGTVPAAISATLSTSSIELGECTSYLRFAPSEAACTFLASSSIQ